MELSEKQLHLFHRHMQDLNDLSHRQEHNTDTSIRMTNRILLLTSIFGMALIFAISIYFYYFYQTVRDSIEGMETVKEQIFVLGQSLDQIDDHINEMEVYVGHIYTMNVHVEEIADETGEMNQHVDILKQHTHQVARHIQTINQSTFAINQQFIGVNQAMGGISGSVYEAAKPIKQFVPLP